MGYRYGSHYLGSPNPTTSNTNQEVIPPHPKGWNKGYNFYRFSFINDQDCHVKINGGDEIYLRANQGFNSTEIDAPIWSFVISEEGIVFNFVAAY